MKINPKKIVSTFLMIWGRFSLLATALFATYLLYSWNLSSQDAINTATKSDVRFVLNWCGLGESRIEKVMQSQKSKRSMLGDHLDAYAIKISNIELAEVTNSKPHATGKWYRGDSLPEILNNATEFIGRVDGEIPWFPSVKSIRTNEFYVYPWKIDCNGVFPSFVQLIFIKPSEKMVYYISLKI